MMNNKISSMVDLKARIRLLESAKREQDEALQMFVTSGLEKLKPSNLIKATIGDLSTLKDSKDDLTSYLLALVTGLLSKKLWVGKSKNPIRKLIGTLVEVWVANFTMKHADTIKMSLRKLTEFAEQSFSAKKKPEEE